jgi:hypothetical protein
LPALHHFSSIGFVFQDDIVVWKKHEDEVSLNLFGLVLADFPSDELIKYCVMVHVGDDFCSELLRVCTTKGMHAYLQNCNIQKNHKEQAIPYSV